MSDCRHLKARIKGSDPFGYTTCYECGRQVYVYEVMNGLFDEMRDEIEETRKQRAALQAKPEGKQLNQSFDED